MTIRMCATALGLASLAFAGSASAALITLDPVTDKEYQHQVQNPCIFSSPSCQNPADFPSTDIPSQGNVESYVLDSPIYSGQQLLNYIGDGNSLLIGLNINQNNGPQTLTSFTMSVNGTVVDTYTGSTGNVPDLFNGLGYADYLLGNFTSFLPTDQIQFTFAFDDANDGPEMVFLASVANSVPEPATLALLGLGLLGACFTRRRK